MGSTSRQAKVDDEANVIPDSRELIKLIAMSPLAPTPAANFAIPMEKWIFHVNAHTFLQSCLLLQFVFLGFDIYLGYYHCKLSEIGYQPLVLG